MEKHKHKPKEKRLSAGHGKPFYNSFKPQDTRFSELFNFRLNGRQLQCKKCHSDGVHLSDDDLCFDCEQRAEFIYREKLSASERIKFLKNPNLQTATI